MIRPSLLVGIRIVQPQILCLLRLLTIPIDWRQAIVMRNRLHFVVLSIELCS